MRRSPSTPPCSSITRLILRTSSSVRSLTRMSGLDARPRSGCRSSAGARSRRCTSARSRRASCAGDRRLQYVPWSLSLPLLVLLVRADHPHHAAAADDLALVANPLHRCSDLHRRLRSAVQLLDRPGPAMRRPAHQRHPHPIARPAPGRSCVRPACARCAVTWCRPSSSTRTSGLGSSCRTTPSHRRLRPRRPAPARRVTPPAPAARPIRRPGRRPPAASEPRPRRPSPPPCARSAPTGCRPSSPPSSRPPAPSPPALPAFTIGSMASTMPSASRGPRPAARSSASAAPRAAPCRCRGRRTRAPPRTRAPRRSCCTACADVRHPRAGLHLRDRPVERLLGHRAAAAPPPATPARPAP